MSGFRRIDDHELGRLSDERLVEYVSAARAAGDAEAMERAVQILAYGHHSLVRARVRAKMERASDAEVEAVVDAVIWGAMLASFRGESVGEFRALLSRIIRRRVADHYRSPRGRGREAPLAEEHSNEDGSWGEQAPAAEELSGVWARDLVEGALDGSSEAHRAVIDHRLAGYTSREAAELANSDPGLELPTPMSDQNVDQIMSRFRRRLRDLIDEAERVGEPSYQTRETNG